MKEGTKPEYLEKTTGDELQKNPGDELQGLVCVTDSVVRPKQNRDSDTPDMLLGRKASNRQTKKDTLDTLLGC